MWQANGTILSVLPQLRRTHSQRLRHNSRSLASRLMRPRNNRMIAGVCAAFAQQYGWDLTLTRIITAIIACFTGAGAIAYLIAWIIIPEEPYALPTNPI